MFITVDVTDPISGHTCKVDKILSSGNYIYHLPSKYDGVYWPHVDEDTKWIWYCPESGYISFGDDFEQLSGSKIGDVSEYLRENHTNQIDRENKEALLLHLENVYRVRGKDEAFWSWFYRVKAFYYEQMDDLERANEIRFNTIPLLEKRIKQLRQGLDLIQHYFILGDYYRRNGDVLTARKYFKKARKVEWMDEDGNHQMGSEYINLLIKEREKLMGEN